MTEKKEEGEDMEVNYEDPEVDDDIVKYMEKWGLEKI